MKIRIYLFNRKHLHDIQVTSSAWWSDSIVAGMGLWFNYRNAVLIFIDCGEKKMFCEKVQLFKTFYFSGHFEWLEANDNALHKSVYLNSSMCHCSSKICRFQFHYSVADSSVLKVVLFTNQVRRNTHSFSKGKDMAARVWPAKMQRNMPASTCLPLKLVCAKRLLGIIPLIYAIVKPGYLPSQL